MTGDSERDGHSGDDRASGLDSVLQGAFWVALLLVAMIAGAIVTVAGVPPGPQIADAYRAGVALYRQATAFSDIYDSDLWYPARWPEGGVLTNRPDATREGLTLYTSGHESAAYLIDMDGEVVHEWRRPFSEIWDETSPVTSPRPDSHVYIRKAVIYPNGDLLTVYEGNGDTPYGYAVVRLDKDSEIVWAYHGRAHHDIDIGPDGRIYALTHELRDETIEPFQHFETPFLDDYLVVLSPDGQEETKLSLTEAIANSSYRQLGYGVSGFSLADPLHTNTVDVVTDRQAAAFPHAEAGQVLLSFRELGAIGILDIDGRSLAWGIRSYWIGQHDPDILDSGNVLIFDNLGNFESETGRSRVIEFDPQTSEIVWRYDGTAEAPLDSELRGGQQRLDNGNTLITESSAGRVVEVTPEGEIAWEFVNPVRGGADDTLIPIVCWAQRIDPERDLDRDFAATLADAGGSADP